ncbi:MAG: antibiotic biosynthesis monooxygenase [Bacteroidia bacterium]|nr:antibiotic biosynthesis monooxygenase [Bacteroidia bacterium]
MFTVIYSFKVKPNKEKVFIDSWKGLTSLIYKHEGSLGSRLHRENENLFIAYAQWPNKETWGKSGGKLPDSAAEFRKAMKDSCISIDTIYKMEVVSNLLKSNSFK